MIPRIKIGLTELFLPVYILAKELYQHVLLLGKSGTGKSTTLARIWNQACIYNFSKIIIEPGGFLAKDCYSMIKGKVHYCSIKRPISLNPMLLPYEINIICDIIAECINQMIELTTANDNLTSKMRNILIEAIKYCHGKDLKSLIHVRDHILNHGDKSDRVTRDGLVQRLNFLLSDERMIPILCGGDPIEWGRMIQKRESFILDGFQMGQEKMIFVGNLISQGLKNYFRFQSPKKRRPVLILIDECHNFVNQNFFDILSEGRKYQLSCVMSAINSSMINTKLWQTMLNVGTILAYRLGHKEASCVAREMNIPAHILQNLEKYHLAYMTPSEQGVAKALRPPIFKRIPIKYSSKKPMKTKGTWFPLRPTSPGKDSDLAGGVSASNPQNEGENPSIRKDG